jgi:hypothetical protein
LDLEAAKARCFLKHLRLNVARPVPCWLTTGRRIEGKYEATTAADARRRRRHRNFV